VADSGTPLITAGQFTESAFGDLVSDWSPQAVADVLIEATRLTEEDAGGRRLAPFTVTETHRAQAVDPDEYGDAANVPMPIQGTLGVSYAQALGDNPLVRHVWVDEFPARYPDMWAYSDVSVQVLLSYGGGQRLTPGNGILDGPDDTGHIWFSIGQYLPVGSRCRVTYSGGYVVNTPASLARSCKFRAAYLVVRELDPKDSNHDPAQLLADARQALAAWARSS
jgi:hypothetical protein